MSRKHASSWEIDDVDPGWDAGTPPRAKPVARVAATWDEREGAFVATIGRWSVRVARAPDRAGGWEWSAFRETKPRALRCLRFTDPEAARQDAESEIARQE